MKGLQKAPNHIHTILIFGLIPCTYRFLKIVGLFLGYWGHNTIFEDKDLLPLNPINCNILLELSFKYSLIFQHFISPGRNFWDMLLPLNSKYFLWNRNMSQFNMFLCSVANKFWFMTLLHLAFIYIDFNSQQGKTQRDF